MRIIIETDYRRRPAAKRYRATEEYIRQNREANLRQQERERAIWNADSAPADAQNTEDKSKDTD